MAWEGRGVRVVIPVKLVLAKARNGSPGFVPRINCGAGSAESGNHYLKTLDSPVSSTGQAKSSPE